MEKIWQPRACIKERLGEMSLLASGYKRYIPTFNTTTYITRAGDCAKKCSSVLATPNMVVVHGRLHISFMSIQKTKYYVINQECQLFFFRIREISGANYNKHLLGNQSQPWRFHQIQVRVYHVVIYSSSPCPLISNVL